MRPTNHAARLAAGIRLDAFKIEARVVFPMDIWSLRKVAVLDWVRMVVFSELT